MRALLPRDRYEALSDSRYLNQASLGLIPRDSVEAMTAFLHGVAQHGNVRMSDAAEARVLDDLRAGAATLLDAPERSIAIIGGASEGLGQMAATLATNSGEVVLVPTDFPSVTYPWLAARDRLGTAIRWVDDRPHTDLSAALIEAVSDSTSVVCVSCPTCNVILIAGLLLTCSTTPICTNVWKPGKAACSSYGPNARLGRM